MASADFGGKITFKLSNGVILAGRGTFTLSTSRFSSEAVTNDDLSLARVLTPKPSMIEISMEDDGQDFEGILTGARFNFTAVEESNAVTHLLSKAFLTGEASINRKNGEVTGISIAGENYQRIN